MNDQPTLPACGPSAIGVEKTAAFQWPAGLFQGVPQAVIVCQFLGCGLRAGRRTLGCLNILPLVYT